MIGVCRVSWRVIFSIEQKTEEGSECKYEIIKEYRKRIERYLFKIFGKKNLLNTASSIIPLSYISPFPFFFVDIARKCSHTKSSHDRIEGILFEDDVYPQSLFDRSLHW